MKDIKLDYKITKNTENSDIGWTILNAIDDANAKSVDYFGNYEITIRKKHRCEFTVIRAMKVDAPLSELVVVCAECEEFISIKDMIPEFNSLRKQ